MSPQLSCGDTCQIWMRFKECKRYFCDISILLTEKLTNRDLVSPTPEEHNTRNCKLTTAGRYYTLRSRQDGRHFPDDILDEFSWMKMYNFPLRFHWSLFLMVQLTIFQHWFRYWLDAYQATSHCLNQWWLFKWRIYASPSLSELTLGFLCRAMKKTWGHAPVHRL